MDALKHGVSFHDDTKCKLVFTRNEIPAAKGRGANTALTCLVFMDKLHQDEPVYGVNVLLQQGR